jgi:hypothetical protein
VSPWELSQGNSFGFDKDEQNDSYFHPKLSLTYGDSFSCKLISSANLIIIFEIIKLLNM